MISTQKSRKGSMRFRLFVLGLAAFPIACAIGYHLGDGQYGQGEKAPPQGWLESRGPVVPHDSFPTECSLCHLGGNWNRIKDDFEFDHAKETGLALTGAHEGAECLRCHNDRGPVAVFNKRGCVGCHTDVHEGQLGRRCQNCHSDSNWIAREIIVQHNRTRFPLIGAHAGVACFRCHPGAAAKNFKRADVSCESCHQEELGNAKNPDHLAQGWTRDCERCHRPVAWAGASFLHTFFPLTGMHASARCESCHVGGVFRGTSRNCVDCHQADFNGAQNPNHLSAGFSTSCDSCHRTDGWRPANYAHQQFPIAGAHMAISCSQCHVGGVYQGTGSACVDCHLDNYNNTQNPNHATAGFSTSCETCHNTVSFRGALVSDHSFFPLTGAHGAVACANCHVGGVFRGTPNTCAGCHLDDYNATTNPNHKTGGFSTDCRSCHTVTAFQTGTFNHSTFPLIGAHSTAACVSCHVGGVFRGTNRTCAGCHLSDYNSTTNPNHQNAGFSTDCQTCHNTIAFQTGGFDHSTFPLQGAHLTAACTDCHIGGVFRGTSRACAGCHLIDYNNTTSPNHRTAGFSTGCQTCHNTNAFPTGGFNHTAYPLTGAHLTVACASCHVNNVFRGTSRTCAGCHLDNFNATTNPNHKTAGFTTDCQTCHTTAAFLGTSINHTSFPLTGAHVMTACANCHVGGVFKGTNRTCAGCHLNRYNATTNPKHTLPSFPHTCDTCHGTSRWIGTVFNHPFPLTGAHRVLQCGQCHVGGIYQGTSTTCAGCHLTNYNSTTNPKHTLPSFPQTCDSCHGTTRWTGAVFNHPWPLAGAHKLAQCGQCHVGGVYRGTATTCAGCHLSNYNNTTNPKHTLPSFSHACDGCHGTSAWIPANFNHPWALTGAHRAAQCARCHAGGVYQGTPTTCVGCHLTNYNNTTNPKHSLPGFPHSCDSCHGTTTWAGAVFNHRFPLNGPHNKPCATCHTNPANYGQFTCFLCHEHERVRMMQKHREVRGFQYLSSACFGCHPAGKN